MIPIKYDEEKQQWVITNEYDEQWYDYKDTSNLKWANVMLSDGKYKASEKNNLEAEGGYKDDGSTVVKEVYNADGTINLEESELGSMFVWIPRYAYSFNSYHTDYNGSEDKAEIQNITKISFLRGTSNTDFEGNTYKTTYNPNLKTESPAGDLEVGKPTPMIVHPGFTFGGKELTGIWVAKFEASMTGTNANSIANNNVVTQNVAPSLGKETTTHNVKILPNINTWRYIDIGNAFMNCYNMTGDSNIYGLRKSMSDSHLIKNIEWGIIAYLSGSQYGYVPTRNSTSKYSNEIYASGNTYQTNTSQSTTNNVTGIYDLNGGSWDYVAAYYDNGEINLLTYGTKNLFNNDKTLKAEYTKYFDKYDVGNDEKSNYAQSRDNLWNLGKSYNNVRRTITAERYKLLKTHIGDAMYEVIKDYSYYGKVQDTNDDKGYSWIKNDNAVNAEYGTGYYDGDSMCLGNCAHPFVYRGGSFDYEGTSYLGVFALAEHGGSANKDRAFRPVIVG